MADNKKEHVEQIRKTFGDEVADKIGNFQEAPGGGKPLAKGEKAPSKDWVQQNRKMQPRDDEGKFTYNAVNLKPLKYGPSRGETTPPVIKGTVFEKMFNQKEATVVNGDNRNKVIVKNGINDFVDLFKRYSEKRGFGFKSDAKKGRWSKAEQEAKETSKQTGKAVVVNKEKLNKRFKKKEEKPEVKKEQPAPTPTQQTSNLKQTAENNKELINQMVNLGVSPADAAKIVASGKISSIEQFKQIMGL